MDLACAASYTNIMQQVFSVVLRTIVSSISNTRLPASTSRKGVYLSCTRSARFWPSMNVRPM